MAHYHEGDVAVTVTGRRDLMRVRQGILDDLKRLDYQFLKYPTDELWSKMARLRDRLNDIDHDILAARAQTEFISRMLAATTDEERAQIEAAYHERTES